MLPVFFVEKWSDEPAGTVCGQFLKKNSKKFFTDTAGFVIFYKKFSIESSGAQQET